MKRYLFLALVLTLSLPAYAEEKAADPAEKKPPSAQALKMKACNAEAKEKKLKGEERKAFMSTCLKNKATT